MKTINIPLGFVILFIMLLMILFKVNRLEDEFIEVKNMNKNIIVVNVIQMDTISNDDSTSIKKLINELESIGE